MSSTSARLSDLQARIHEWCAGQFPEQTAATILAHLGEEVAELRQRDTAEEAADALILLLAWAGHTGLPLVSPNTMSYWSSRLLSSAREILICTEIGQATLNEARYFLAYLLAWSALGGHDLLAAAEAKHAVNLTRSWARGADGIHRHVKDGGQ